MKKVLPALILFYCSTVFSQKNSFKPYNQKIGETEFAIEMVAIPAGEFMMGSSPNEKGRNDDEGPQHKVKLSAFWMSAKEIPWNIYEIFVYPSDTATKVDAVTRPSKPYVDVTFGMGKDDHPAVAMTQYNAIQFCKWLYKQTGIFYRLPTEAEWEYACRAGTSSTYYFGNDEADLGEYAWYTENSNGKTMPVGKKKPNRWGLYDMHGNVSEWTYDQYDENFYSTLASGTATNPVSEPVQLYPHTLRGGSFSSEAAACRCASRLPSDPSWKRLDPQMPKSNWWFPEAPFVGLRIVRPLIVPSEEEIRKYYDRKPVKDF